MSEIKKSNGPSENIPPQGSKGPKEVKKFVKAAAKAALTLTSPMAAALSLFSLQSPSLKKLVKEKKITPDTAKKATAKAKDTLAENAFGVRSIDKGSIA